MKQISFDKILRNDHFDRWVSRIGWMLLGALLYGTLFDSSISWGHEVADIVRLRDATCVYETLGHPTPNSARSTKDAIGQCQLLAATAKWLAPHAVRYGYVGAWAKSIDRLDLWEAILEVEWVNRALALTFYRWMYHNRTRDTLMLAYKYHAGQNAKWHRRTRSARYAKAVARIYKRPVLSEDIKLALL